MDDRVELNNRDLAQQASLLILLAGSLLMGLGGLLLDLFPQFPMPPQLDISLDGSLAILMIGGGLTGVVRRAVSIGVTGIVLSMTLWLLGSWTQHNERLTSAEKLADNLAMSLEEVTRSRAELIQRMAKRWQAAGGLPDRRVREEEARNYFCDEASLQALEKLLQHADMAMYKAKQQGRNAFQCYTDLDSKLSQRVTLRNELQEALDHDQLVLHYQPLLDAAGRVDGLEALVRWQHPTKGFISPADFIPLSEETGQIIPFSRWVMARAYRDARPLVDQGLLVGRMAVNLSPMQFHRPSFLATLRRVLDETGLPAGHLELELTEGILMRDTEGAIDILNALNGMGISTAIDDFGTGFSSLGYLRTLPIDKIKIDRTFVKDVTRSDKDAAICQGIITLARELDLRVVAEGIEIHDQHDYLRHHGCEVFQGYLFARPMPLDTLVEWLERQPTS